MAQQQRSVFFYFLDELNMSGAQSELDEVGVPIRGGNDWHDFTIFEHVCLVEALKYPQYVSSRVLILRLTYLCSALSSKVYDGAITFFTIEITSKNNDFGGVNRTCKRISSLGI